MSKPGPDEIVSAIRRTSRLVRLYQDMTPGNEVKTDSEIIAIVEEDIEIMKSALSAAERES